MQIKRGCAKRKKQLEVSYKLPLLKLQCVSVYMIFSDEHCGVKLYLKVKAGGLTKYIELRFLHNSKMLFTYLFAHVLISVLICSGTLFVNHN